MSIRTALRPTARRWLLLISRPEQHRIGMVELRVLYGLWLAAFMLKLIGSSWDVAWHFRFLRDDFAPPHLINTIGTLLALGLLLIHSYRGLAVDRHALRIAQLGAGVFVLAIPLDLLNHRIFGLDLTAWSATHMLLYVGTGLLLVGVLRSWLVVAPVGRTRTIYALALGALLLEDVLFPLGQQEFGVHAIDAFLHGQPSADADLLALADGNLVTLIQGSLPVWLYPVWLMLGSSAVLLAVRRMIPVRFTATIISVMYLGYRVIADTVLTAGAFPPTFIPFMLLVAALALDGAAMLRWGTSVTSLAVVSSFYVGAALIDRVALMPSFPLSAAPLVVVLLWAMLRLSRWGSQGRQPQSAGSSAAHMGGNAA